ncbi:DUF2768 domain-containing protein [Mesobacillus zeae]|uniref:DUF2768 domain-containing protein n=1 Tax=Mesobacillus zeae TaxID=1917180 RepID=A0A398BD12_9BACI|nr:DUF2768 domain-containing protein [Mesobacillus zeae]RID87301.1 DUF2768 domain-containing protein [Mesobacillus zeae]
MSPGLLKMYVSFAGMASMGLSLLFLYFSRYKLKGTMKFITAFIAYILMIFAGIVIFIVVMSGPTN